MMLQNHTIVETVLKKSQNYLKATMLLMFWLEKRSLNKVNVVMVAKFCEF